MVDILLHLSDIARLLLKIVGIAYLISSPIAIYITYKNEKNGYRLEDAPNRVLEVLAQFCSIWLIMPPFLIKYIGYTLKFLFKRFLLWIASKL